jgi:ribokinase
MDVMTREKINIDAVARGNDPAGRAFISVDANGENIIIVVPGSNAKLKAGHGVEIVENSKVVLAQLEIPLDAVIAAFASARRAGAVTVLNPAPVRDLPDELLELCDYVVPNQVEAQHIGGVARCLALGVKAVITTLGANGVQIDSAEGSEKIGSIQVTAVDTTAAGDAFLGGFCSSLASGAVVNEAVRVGAIAGAVAVTREGAVPSLPTAEEVAARRADLSS